MSFDRRLYTKNNIVMSKTVLNYLLYFLFCFRAKTGHLVEFTVDSGLYSGLLWKFARIEP